MLNVTEKAVERIQDFLKNRPDPRSIRILLSEGG